MTPLVLVDVSNLCHRAFHTTGNLSHNGKPTGVIFGFFNQLLTVAKSLFPCSFVFCFDSRESLRREIYPEYKRGRVKGDLTPDEMEQRQGLYNQINDLRGKLLQRLGWGDNILYREGYEADDLIAWITLKLINHPIRIFSSDEDVYQLLNDSTFVFNPNGNRIFTKQDFLQKYGVHPTVWPTVKAIAGCSSDNVKGIKGVGEVTACKFLNANLPRSSKKWLEIERFISTPQAELNRALVTLPFGGMNAWADFLPQVDVLSGGEFMKKAVFYDFFQEYGLKQMVSRLPEWSQYFNLK